MGKPGLELVIADLMMTGLALGAAAASADKRQGDAVTGFPETDMGADFLDRSAEFVAGNLGQLHVRIMTLPGMPVAATDAGGTDADHGPVNRRGWIRKFLDGQGFSEVLIDSGFHGVLLPVRDRISGLCNVHDYTGRRRS